MRDILKNYLSIIIMLLIALTVGILLWAGVLDVNTIITTARDKKLLALVIIMGLYIMKGVSMMFPVAAICIGTSLVFDVYTAVLINIVGNAICVSLSYLVGRLSKGLTFDGFMEKHPKLKKYFSNAQEYSFTFCFAVHTSHLSMEAQGVLFGLLRTPYLPYLGGTMLALLPSTVYFTIFGSAFDLTDPVFWVFIGLDAMMVILGLIYAKRNIIDGGSKSSAQ